MSKLQQYSPSYSPGKIESLNIASCTHDVSHLEMSFFSLAFLLYSFITGRIILHHQRPTYFNSDATFALLLSLIQMLAHPIMILMEQCTPRA